MCGSRAKSVLDPNRRLSRPDGAVCIPRHGFAVEGWRHAAHRASGSVGTLRCIGRDRGARAGPRRAPPPDSEVKSPFIVSTVKAAKLCGVPVVLSTVNVAGGQKLT